MDVLNCPHCRILVLPCKDGQCPSCRKQIEGVASYSKTPTGYGSSHRPPLSSDDSEETHSKHVGQQCNVWKSRFTGHIFKGFGFVVGRVWPVLPFSGMKKTWASLRESVLQFAAWKNITSKTTGMKLTLIPAGTFTMGSPNTDHRCTFETGRQHSVQISEPFYLGVYEVTQEEYETVMGVNPSLFRKYGPNNNYVNNQQTGRLPVENVSWYDAIEFCNKMSEKDGLPTFYDLKVFRREGGSIVEANGSMAGGNGYRLPTEAEWEYACRGLTTTAFHLGEMVNCDHANVDELPNDPEAKGAPLKRTTRVGSYAKNAFGLFDMHGNVGEWCFDFFDSQEYDNRSGTTKDPIVEFESGCHYGSRVLRGGSWNENAIGAQSDFRGWCFPEERNSRQGFRIARNSTPNSLLKMP